MPRDAEFLSRYKCPLSEKKVGREKDDNSWGRFAILPNVNGQKYTIGNYYTSREEQGEFIFLAEHYVAVMGGGRRRYDEEERKPAVKTGLEISIDDNRYFVSPIYEGTRIYINDVQITRKTELEYGNILALDDKNFTFRFKGRDLHRRRNLTHKYWLEDKDEEEKRLKDVLSKMKTAKGEFTPGQNGLILSQILSHLPFDELKSVRLVAKNWSEEAFNLIRKRATLSLDFSRCIVHAERSMRLFQYSLEMRDRPLRNLHIEVGRIGPRNWVDTSPGKSGLKLQDDLKTYILNGNPAFQSMKRLNLGGTIDSMMDYEIRLKLLQILGKGLEELTWSGHWLLGRDPRAIPTFPENILLNKLQVFTLNIHDYDRGCSSLVSWLQNLMNVIQGISTLRVENYPDFDVPFMNIVHDSVSRKLFPNLTGVDILHVDAELIRILIKLDRPLKKLWLRDYEYSDIKREDIPHLDQLLLKHAPSLESLEFLIPQIEEGDNEIHLRFPAFPKLHRLKVFWNRESRLTETDFLVKLAFPGGRINYENHFPSLRYLSLKPGGFQEYSPDGSRSTPLPTRAWNNVAWFYEAFLPVIAPDYGGEPEICRSLQRLDIVHQISADYSREVLELFPETAETGIASMFPNVYNPWINSIRERAGLKIKTEIKMESKTPELEPTSGRRLTASNKLRGGSGKEESRNVETSAKNSSNPKSKLR